MQHPGPNSRDQTGPRQKLESPETPEDIEPINVTGRRPTTPGEGFGQLWSKSYTLAFADSTVRPEAVIAEWKDRFDQFWPQGNRFYVDGPLRKGKVAALKLGFRFGPHVYTGMLVTDSDARSFRLASAQGHMFTGWLRLSAGDEDGRTVLQVEVRMRATDPFYEACLLFGGHGLEDTFWERTLTAVAEFFKQEGPVIKRRRLLDRHRNWGRAWLIWYNAALRSMLWEAIAPVRSLWTKLRLAAQRDA